MRGPFKVGAITAERGKRAQGWLEVSRRADGSVIGFPVIVLHGSEDGPVLLVDGCTHGDEVETAMAVQHVVARLDPSQIHGTLLAVPVVNMLALDAMQRTTATHVIDNPDINRVFPGAADGSMTQRLAHVYTEQVISRAQFMITLHSAGLMHMGYGTEGMVIYEYEGGDVDEKAREMAKAFGCGLLSKNAHPGLVTSSSSVARARGVPAICPEIGGTDRLPSSLDHSIGLHVEGVLNVMRYLGMLNEPAKSRGSWIEFDGHPHVRTSRDGFVQAYPGIGLGTMVKKGQKVVAVRDVFGHEVETVTAPWDGVVTLLRTYSFAHGGDFVIEIGPNAHVVNA
jgi:predicted deacylase